MELHHDKHHAGYVEKLNEAIEPFPELQERSASWLLLNLNKVPEEARTAIRNNAGGHVNHSLFWKAMSPRTIAAPTGRMADAISRDFGSLDRYYLKHQNRRADYLRGWWGVVDWDEVSRRFEHSDHAAATRGATEGDLLIEAA